MARKQFETVVATAPRQSTRASQASSSAILAAGQSETFDIYAPAGKVGRVQTCYMNTVAVPGATSGTHRIVLRQSDLLSGNLVSGSSNWNETIQFEYGQWVVASLTKYPATEAAAGAMIRGVLFDDLTALQMLYINSTNGPAGQLRSFNVGWVESDATK